MKIHLHKKYLIITSVLLLTEILIARYEFNKLVRNYIGDVLVVMLIYCFIKTFWNTPVLKSALTVFVFACFIETLQYFQLLSVLHLQDSNFAALLLGRKFSWGDIGMYAAGVLMIPGLEKLTSECNG